MLCRCRRGCAAGIALPCSVGSHFAPLVNGSYDLADVSLLCCPLICTAGAGVAALLALHYRGLFPRVRVWCFAPPGGLMSPAAAASLKDICYSLVSAKVCKHTRGNLFWAHALEKAGCTCPCCTLADVTAAAQQPGLLGNWPLASLAGKELCKQLPAQTCGCCCTVLCDAPTLCLFV